jgi:hypothetical protein
MKTHPALLVTVVIATLGAVWLAHAKITAAESQARELRSSPSSVDSLEQQVIAKEREGLEALKTGDLDRFGKLTGDDAIFVDAAGPASKAQVLTNVAGFKLTDYTMEDVKFLPISKNTGLVSYKTTEKGVSHGKEFTAKVYVSSVWAERGHNWVCLFSQETGAR